MATAISLNYGISDPKTCRVEITPSSCPLGLNSSIKGSQTYTTPTGVVYRNFGMTVQDYNRGLRLPQQRTFVGPEYFNSGCTSLYCKDAQMCPSSVEAQSCERTTDMLDYLFERQSDFTGNNAPPPCFGGKCVDYGSTLGWQLSSSTDPASQQQLPVAWQTTQGASFGGCNTPLGL